MAGSSVAYDSEGRLLAFDRTIPQLWDVDAGKLLATFGEFGGNFTAVSPDGRWIAATGPSYIQLWDVTSEKLFDVLPTFRLGSVMVFSVDSKELAFNGSDGHIVLWDIANHKPRVILQDTFDSYHLIFSPDGKFLLTSNRPDPTPTSIEVRDAISGKKFAKIYIPGDVSRIALSPDAKLLAFYLDRDYGTLHVWDFANKKEAAVLYAVSGNFIFTPDNHLLFLDGGNTAVMAWDMISARENLVLKLPHLATGAVAEAQFSLDGKFVLYRSSSDNFTKMYILDIADGTVGKFEMPMPALPIILPVISANRSVIVNNGDATIQLWGINIADK